MFKQEVTDKGDYVYVTLSGEWDVKEAGKNVREGMEQTAKFGKSKILVDTRALAVVTTRADDYFQVEELLMQGLYKWKVAVLGKPERKEAYGFYELAASNRGLRLKFFLEESEAVAWLRSD